MYEKTFNNITNVVFCGLLLVLLLWGTVSNIRLVSTQKHLRRTESELGQLRTELESAQNRESELKGAVGNIRIITERTDSLLDQSTDTIQGIRKEVQILEDYFNSINQYLCSNDNNNDDSTDSEE